MIPLATRRRLTDALPAAYDITIDGSTYRRNLNYAWQGEDREPDYPSVELNLAVTGERRAGEQPLGQYLRNLDVDDPTIALNRLEGERLFDELSIQVATRGELLDTSAAERAHVICQMLESYCRFGLTEEMWPPGDGPNELSMTAEIVSGPVFVSDLVDDMNTPTWQFTVRLHYTATRDVLVPALADTEIEYRLVF